MKLNKKKNTVYIKLTDKTFYIFHNKLFKYDGKYIKNGKVDDVKKLIVYLNKILPYSIYKYKYIFILDTLLCNSDLFTYRYVFENMGLSNYQIKSDVDIIKSKLNDNNIFLFNWSSSCNYAYINNKEIVINKINTKVINNMNKTYIISVGDEYLSSDIKIPLYKSEYEELTIFNYL